MKKTLLICGIVSSALYVFMNIIATIRYEGYNIFSQTVSELSAVDAPTRPLWVPLGIAYTLLVAAFGLGVRKSAEGNQALRIVGTSLIAYGVIGVFWPPMHQREVLAAGGKTLTDTMHLAFAGVAVVLMVLAIGAGAAAFEKWFRFYCIFTISALVIFGVLTARVAPSVEANLSTPWAGVWERINIAVFLLWIIVLAMVLLSRGKVSKGCG
jgi:hypothetical protein